MLHVLPECDTKAVAAIATELYGVELDSVFAQLSLQRHTDQAYVHDNTRHAVVPKLGQRMHAMLVWQGYEARTWASMKAIQERPPCFVAARGLSVVGCPGGCAGRVRTAPW